MYFQLRNGRQLIDSGVDRVVVGLDQSNMAAVLAGLGEEFDPDIRRASMYNNQYVFILAWDEFYTPERLLGYLQYGPEGDDPLQLWIHSVQLHPDYQGGPLLARLVCAAGQLLQKSRFSNISFMVHKVHEKAMGFYRRLGFQVKKDDYSMFTFRVTGTPETFVSPGFQRLIERYGKRQKQTA